MIKKRKYIRAKIAKAERLKLKPKLQIADLVNIRAASPEEQLMADRQAQYGAAWEISNDLIAWLDERTSLKALIFHGAMFSWTIILNKVIRLIQSPKKVDSWRDIEIYAKLMADHLEAEDGER